MVNINAQNWLNEKYPINGTCRRNNDSENKGKRREEITKLDISKGKLGRYLNEKKLVGSLKLEGFANLRKLIVSFHQLVELDVSDCLKLEELDCCGNQLGSLKVNSCSLLKKIDCSNNHLRELKLNNCVELNELNCISNSLGEVDVSKCPELKEEKITSDLICKGSKLVKIISQITRAKDDDIRNILIVGVTGNGKSTLANVLTDVNQFTENASSTSITKNFQKSDIFEWQGKKYCVIDNIGFGDTASLSEKDILSKIGEGIYSAKEGINQVLFVINGKFSPEHIAAFNLFKDFIDETGITKFTTIIKTNFADFRSLQKCEEDRSLLISESKELSMIINYCNGIIYVNNPSIPFRDEEDDSNKLEIKINSEKREVSRERVLNHLSKNCQEIYKLKEWDSIHYQVAKCMAKIEEDEEKLAKSGSNSEKKKLQSKIEEEKDKIAEEVNIKFVAEIGVVPKLGMEAEFKNPNCCSIS